MDKPTVLIVSCELKDDLVEEAKSLLEKAGVDVLIVDEAHIEAPFKLPDIKELKEFPVELPSRRKDYKPEQFKRSERRAANRRNR